MTSEQALPVFYSFRRCPYAIRARLALRYANIRVHLREVVLREKPEEMLAVSPKGTVPVMVLSENPAQQEVIEESLDIMFWSLAQHDPDGWLDVDIGLANALIDANDEQFKPWLDRYKYPDRYEGMTSQVAREQCDSFLRELDSRLQQHVFICGERASIVDYAIYSFVRQFAFVDIAWFESGVYPGLHRWLDGFLQSDLFAGVMQKYPQWHPGDPAVVF